jgi:hypothetical protein
LPALPEPFEQYCVPPIKGVVIAQALEAPPELLDEAEPPELLELEPPELLDAAELPELPEEAE